MKSSISFLGCVVRLIGSRVLPATIIGVLVLGISFADAQTLPPATASIYTQVVCGISETNNNFNPVGDVDNFGIQCGPVVAYFGYLGNTTYSASGNITLKFVESYEDGFPVLGKIEGYASSSMNGYNKNFARAHTQGDLRYYFNVVQIGSPSWNPSTIPVEITARAAGSVDRGYGNFSASVFVGGYVGFPSDLFKIFWTGGPHSASFDQSVTLHLPINNQYWVYLSAVANANSPNVITPYVNDEVNVASVFVDPIIRFDQEAFNAICTQEGKQCFSLSDYYKLEFSPNLIVNRPPALDPIGNQQANEGQLLQFIITASDPDGDTLTYEASNLPAGATFDANTQTFQWTPGYAQAGSYQNVLFKVTDSGTPMASASEAITITVGNVNRPPALDPIGSKTVKEGQLLTITITANDPDGDTLTYSASNLPAGATFDPTTQTFSWSPAYDQAGNYPEVRFTVTDSGIPAASASEAITITVGNVNRLPVLASIGHRTTNEGELLEFTITAIDPDGDALTYSANNLPSGATFDPGAQKFSWTPGYDQAGNYPNIEFTVTDNGDPMESDTKLITITVGNVNRAPVFAPVGTQQVIENQLLQFSVMATDYDGDGITYSTSSLPNGASFDASSRLFSWRPDSTQAGTYVVAFFATDNGSPPMTDQLDVVITVGDMYTPCELADQIIQTVLILNLSKSVENSYMANLKKVCRFVEEGKITPAINQLNAFINKVRTDITKGNINQTGGNNLIDMATNLMGIIKG
jgi:hypothetical protein